MLNFLASLPDDVSSIMVFLSGLVIGETITCLFAPTPFVLVVILYLVSQRLGLLMTKSMTDVSVFAQINSHDLLI